MNVPIEITRYTPAGDDEVEHRIELSVPVNYEPGRPARGPSFACAGGEPPEPEDIDLGEPRIVAWTVTPPVGAALRIVVLDEAQEVVIAYHLRTSCIWCGRLTKRERAEVEDRAREAWAEEREPDPDRERDEVWDREWDWRAA
jgi:hypothetical protein